MALGSSPSIVLSVCAIVLAALFWGALRYMQSNMARASDPLAPSYVDDGGDDSAPTSIVVYSDFLCPECAALARDVLPTIQADFIDDGTARLVFRHYPHLGGESMRAAAARYSSPADSFILPRQSCGIHWNDGQSLCASCIAGSWCPLSRIAVHPN